MVNLPLLSKKPISVETLLRVSLSILHQQDYDDTYKAAKKMITIYRHFESALPPIIITKRSREEYILNLIRCTNYIYQIIYEYSFHAKNIYYSQLDDISDLSDMLESYLWMEGIDADKVSLFFDDDPVLTDMSIFN